MESLNENRVLEDLQEKEAREQIRSQKREAKEAAKEAEGSPLRRLVSYIEFGGIIVLVGAFRKPLAFLAQKIFRDVEKEVIVVDEKLKAAIESAEISIRQKIINQYLLDPIQCYRLGGELYTQLVNNAAWPSTIYTHLDSIPSSVSSTFVIGTGIGSITATPNLARCLSVQLLGIVDSLLITGQNLQ